MRRWAARHQYMQGSSPIDCYRFVTQARERSQARNSRLTSLPESAPTTANHGLRRRPSRVAAVAGRGVAVRTERRALHLLAALAVVVSVLVAVRPAQAAVPSSLLTLNVTNNSGRGD